MMSRIFFNILAILLILTVPGSNAFVLFARPITLSQNIPRYTGFIGIAGPALIHKLKENHYAFDRILPDISKKRVRNHILFALDPEGLLFLKEDVERLEEINERSAPGILLDEDFFKLTYVIYKNRLLDAKSMIEQVGSEPLRYEEGGSLRRYSPENMDPAENREALLSRWRDLFRYESMIQTYNPESRNSYPEFLNRLNQEKTRLLSGIKENQLSGIRSKLNPPDGMEKWLASIYFNALTGEFDPHTMYFSEADKRSMDAMLSDQAYSFGMVLRRNFIGELQVEQLIPGGPAWKSGKINEGDLITRILLPSENHDRDGDEKGYNVMILNSEKLNELLNPVRNHKIILIIQKPGKLSERVTLYRARMEVETNRVNGFILNGKTRFGYIYLPSFYMGDGSPLNPGCADDVAREILKLRRERIEGLILDLRNNSGGSLKEALDLSGIFVDQGPLHIQKSSGSTYVIKDPNRGTVYGGPLIVIVNGASASASEFFTQAMKDYNRAIIVGTPTYGKASAQEVLPVGPMGLGYLKVTVSLFFNLQGGTHQGDGVQPNMELPDLSIYFKKEKDSSTALLAESIDRNIPHTQFNSGIDSEVLDRLSERSNDRRDDKGTFDKIMAMKNDLSDIFEMEELDLAPENFYRMVSRAYNLLEKLRADLKNPNPGFEVRISGFDEKLNQMDPFRKEMNHLRIEDIQSDIYIDETYNILTDFIEITKR